MNADDICAELAAARAYITRGDYTAALEAIDQATRVWSAERDYWAHIELLYERGEREPGMTEPVPIETLPEPRPMQPTMDLSRREMSVRWGRRTDTGGMDDGDWRTHA